MNWLNIVSSNGQIPQDRKKSNLSFFFYNLASNSTILPLEKFLEKSFEKSYKKSLRYSPTNRPFYNSAYLGKSLEKRNL